MITGLFIVVLVSCGLYLNYKLDVLLQPPGSFLAGNYPGNLTGNEAVLQGENGITKRRGPAAAKAGIKSEAKPDNTQLDSNENLVNDVQNKVGQPVDKIDLLKASMIIMRKLSAEEISYLSKVAMKDAYSQEDYQQSQEILLNKLSAEDINALKKLGKKYGKDFEILNPNGK